MQALDTHVINAAVRWLETGHTVWFCTVLSTFGSSPREPGAIMVALQTGEHVGSLSGGCVEDNFLERLQAAEFDCAGTCVRYGDKGDDAGRHVTLPCGGSLEVLVQRWQPEPDTLAHARHYAALLSGDTPAFREVSLTTFQQAFSPAEDADALADTVSFIPPLQAHQGKPHAVRILVGPVSRLIIVGVSPVSQYCADFAKSLGFEVIVCDSSETRLASLASEGIHKVHQIPALYLLDAANVHRHTAIVAVTHDPRIDDVALMEAVKTPAFYIGVMGSQQTSRRRAERLQRSGGLSHDEIQKIHMPIGLALGSKTPAEIALSVMADILRVRRGRSRSEL